MAGIYLHIPFCKQACHYCDFHFSTSLKNKEAFLNALLMEIELQQNYFDDKNATVHTIYLGGGTPSLLNYEELQLIFEKLQKHFVIAKDAEITLEANPDDLNIEKISQLKQTDVNRLSIGIQSFFDVDLKLMNRAHTAKDADYAIKASQDKGFENISIDFIYGIQTLSNENWKQNLAKAFELKVPHLSAYCLTVEEKTALAHFIKTKKLEAIDEEKNAVHFQILLEQMKAHQFIQYEISNFCRDGFYSKHNSNYWRKEHYLGLGPSAHSYNGTKRTWNIANNARYIQGIREKKLLIEEEILTKNQRYNELVMTALRTMWGVSISEIELEFGSDFKNHFLKEAQFFVNSNDLQIEENKATLTDKGKLIADKIASELFLVN
jgi:oxygen-independent coproporphyrinogen III oxidase